MNGPLGRLLAVGAAVLSLFAVWQLAAWNLPEYLLPGVPQTLRRLSRMISQPSFTDGLRQSMFRLLVGYSIACALGTLLGLLASLSRSFRAYLRSLIAILQSIPPVTWAPFLIILYGFGNPTAIPIVALASFFPMALSAMNATEGVNQTHLELARVLGASRLQLVTGVYAPEALPAVITGAQVAFGNAWRSLVAVEMVGAANRGLGFSLRFAGEIADMAGVLAYIVVIGTIAAFLDLVVLERLKRHLLKWRYLTEGGDP
jgi:NitT/TauT family transport system permease protein